MTHAVTQVRTAVRAALETALPGVDWVKNYWLSIDREQLPRGAVFTPKARVAKFDDDTIERLTEVNVILKRSGGADLEDEMWADSAQLESVVLGVLEGFSYDYDLDEVDVKMDGDGARSVGTLMMQFSLRLLTAEGQPENPILPD